jgi:hypothetical protein
MAIVYGHPQAVGIEIKMREVHSTYLKKTANS